MFLLKSKYEFGYTIRGHNHNHPNNTPSPSGLDGKPGDVGFARYLTNAAIRNNSNIPTFGIYIPKTKNYIQYNRNSTIYDFPEKLPEIVLTPRKIK